MKCFKCKLDVPYGNGCVLVAAHSKEEAVGVVMQEYYYKEAYSKADKYEEIEGLDYDTDKPCLIFEHSYEE
ncbi:MAG: hypothetical protein J6W77_07730 [Prevotella sp.]|nr:hypothetical protein [Prevotella sp.]